MPIFEYLCQDCGTKFEKLIRGQATQLECPSCGKDHLRQELSTFAAHSGSGAAPQTMPSGGGCGASMCGTPGFCGRN